MILLVVYYLSLKRWQMTLKLISANISVKILRIIVYAFNCPLDKEA